MRVSETMRYAQVARSLGSLAGRQAEAARRASTGQRVGRPSADPIAAAELVRIEAALRRTQTHQTTIRDVSGDAQLAEGVLAEAGDVFLRLRELAMQAANDSLGAAERDGIADEVAELRSQLIGIANTKGARGYIFAGHQIDAEPFSAAGVFSGDDGAHNVEVGDGVTSRVNVSGAQAFTAAGGVDIFAELTSFEAALRANDTAAIASSLTPLDASRDQLLAARADAGLITSRLDVASAVLDRSELALTEQSSVVGDADAFSSIGELSQVSSTIEQAIAVARTTLNTSLARF